jgi:hypothetical protein
VNDATPSVPSVLPLTNFTKPVQETNGQVDSSQRRFEGVNDRVHGMVDNALSLIQDRQPGRPRTKRHRYLKQRLTYKGLRIARSLQVWRSLQGRAKIAHRIGVIGRPV